MITLVLLINIALVLITSWLIATIDGSFDDDNPLIDDGSPPEVMSRLCTKQQGFSEEHLLPIANHKTDFRT